MQLNIVQQLTLYIRKGFLVINAGGALAALSLRSWCFASMVFLSNSILDPTHESSHVLIGPS